MKPLNPSLAVLALGAICVIGAMMIGAAPASPPVGSDAPPINLKDLSGESVNTAGLAPKPLVLIFGEMNHDGAKRACQDVLDVLADPRLANTSAIPILIVAEDAPDPQLKERAGQGRFPAVILHDVKRDAYGAYRVLVIPTVVVVDGKGKVVHAMPGFLQRFKEILTECVLVASGKESADALAQTVANKSQSASHDVVRAERLVHMANELTRHGLYNLAEPRFAEASALVPGHVGAALGLGDLMLRQNRLDDAEPLYRSVLATNAGSVEATLGLADIDIRRGGDGLAKAAATIDKLVAKDPQNARARYLLGTLRERRGDSAGAMAEYKKAAELAMDR